VVLRETSRAVTPFGGVAVLVVFLQKLRFINKVRQARAVPVHLVGGAGRNSLPAPRVAAQRQLRFRHLIDSCAFARINSV